MTNKPLKKLIIQVKKKVKLINSAIFCKNNKFSNPTRSVKFKNYKTSYKTK